MVGKSDFNENPFVSLDLDLDFDLGFVIMMSHFQIIPLREFFLNLFLENGKMRLDSQLFLKHIDLVNISSQ